MWSSTANYRSTRALAVVLMAATMSIACAYAQTPPTSNAGLAQFTQRQNEAPVPNFGKPIPANLMVSNEAGQSVALASVVHGPAVVIKSADGCPPCSALLSYVQAHGEAFMREHHAQIVVLTIASAATAPASGYPKGVVTVHTNDMMTTGILGGTTLPAMYFFDKNARLVGEHTAVYNASNEAMAAALQFPARRAQ